MSQGQLQGVGQALANTFFDDQTVYDDVDVVFFGFAQFGDLFDIQYFAVDTNTGKPFFFQPFEKVLVAAFLTGDQRRQNNCPGTLSQGHDPGHNLVYCLGRDGTSASVTMGGADSGKQQPQVVIYFSDRTDRRARVMAGCFLFNRNGR